MKRVLHVISQLEDGGAQRQLAYLLDHGGEYEMEVAALIASPREKLFSAFRNSRVPIHFCSNSGDYYAPEILPDLRGLIKVGRYALVHLWLYQSIVQGVISCRLENVPCIASPRSMRDAMDYEKNKSWEKWLVSKTLDLADLVLFPSASSAVDFVDAGWCDPARCRVVLNGVDTDHFCPQGRGRAIVTVARDSNIKCLDDLDYIVGRLRADFPDLQCLVAGTSRSNRPSLQSAGYVEDVREVLKEGQIFISTSLTEGMSNALLEAQSMGIPAVARNVGANSEIIEDNFTGFLVSNVDEMYEASKKLLEVPDLLDEMGKRARERMVGQFSIIDQIKKIQDVYSELV